MIQSAHLKLVVPRCHGWVSTWSHLVWASGLPRWVFTSHIRTCPWTSQVSIAQGLCLGSCFLNVALSWGSQKTTTSDFFPMGLVSWQQSVHSEVRFRACGIFLWCWGKLQGQFLWTLLKHYSDFHYVLLCLWASLKIVIVVSHGLRWRGSRSLSANIHLEVNNYFLNDAWN